MLKKIKKYLSIYEKVLAVLFIGISVWLLLSYLSQKKDAKLSVISATTSPDEMAQIVKAYCAEQKDGAYRDVLDCYAVSLAEITIQTDYKHSFSGLLALSEIDTGAKSCHLAAHKIGQAAYKKDPKKWKQIFSTISTDCGYGGMHGVVEGYLSEAGVIDKQTILTVCGSDFYPGCLHAIGHVLLLLQDGSLYKAKDICSAFGKEWQKQHCLNGVFMEYFYPLNLIDHGLASGEKVTNLSKYLPEHRKICLKEKHLESLSCWTEISHTAVYVFNADANQFYRFCENAQDMQSAYACKIEGLTELLASAHFDLNKGKNFCNLEQSNGQKFKEDCFNMLAQLALYNNPKEIHLVVSYCKSLDKQYYPGCSNEIRSIVKALAKRKNISPHIYCSSLADKDKNLCVDMR